MILIANNEEEIHSLSNIAQDVIKAKNELERCMQVKDILYSYRKLKFLVWRIK